MHDSNKILTAIPRVFGVRQFMAAIFDLSLSQTAGSFQTCYFVLLDLRNIKITLKIAFLSCTQPEM